MDVKTGGTLNNILLLLLPLLLPPPPLLLPILLPLLPMALRPIFGPWPPRCRGFETNFYRPPVGPGYALLSGTSPKTCSTRAAPSTAMLPLAQPYSHYYYAFMLSIQVQSTYKSCKTHSQDTTQVSKPIRKNLTKPSSKKSAVPTLGHCTCFASS